MLWESVSILRRIFQGFEEANLTPHALKPIEKANLVDNFFCQKKFLRKMSWQNRAHFWTPELHPQKQVRKHAISELISELLPKGEDT